jgi:hypothetical protein
MVFVPDDLAQQKENKLLTYKHNICFSPRFWICGFLSRVSSRQWYAKARNPGKVRNPSFYCCNLLEPSENHDAWKKSLRFVHSEPVSAIFTQFQKEKTLVAVSLQILVAMVEYHHRLKINSFTSDPKRSRITY